MNLSINKGTPTASTKDWKDGTQCQKCKTAFSWTTRKHHCRSCGGVFCGRCSSHTKVIPKWGSQPVRVCDDCFSEPQKVTSSPPDPDQFPYGQSPPVELNLSSSMPRTLFESWVGEEEPTVRWVSNPNPYGTSPTSTLSSTPPEFFLDPDMEVKTAEELEEDRQKELKELEQRRVRKEEKKRRKAIEKLIAEEKKKEAAKASSVGGEAKDKEAEGEATPKESGPGLTINVQKSAAIGAEGTSRTPPSENDVALVHLDNNTNSPLNTSMLLQHPPSPVTSTEPRRLGHPEENAAEAEKDVPPSNTTTPQATPTPSRATKATPAEGERRRTSGRKGRNGPNENNNSIKRKKRAAQKLENNTISAKLKELASALLSGLFDSLKLKYAFLSLSRSSTAFYRARDVLILSVLLLGSYLVFLNVLIPHIDQMLNWKQHTNAAVLVIVYTVDFVLKAIFWLLWLGPLYGLSIVLYAHWYEGIAYGSFGLHVFWKKGVKMNADSRGLATVIGEAVYRSLIFGAFIGIGWLCGWVPYVGSLLYFLNICWTYSVYCFEYKWNNQSWGLNRKLEYFETRWIYFAGFGLPFALTSFWLDYVTGYCLLALLFPVFIPVAMYGNPSRQKAWQPIPLSRFLDNSIFTPVILFVKSKFRTG